MSHLDGIFQILWLIISDMDSCLMSRTDLQVGSFCNAILNSN